MMLTVEKYMEQLDTARPHGNHHRVLDRVGRVLAKKRYHRYSISMSNLSETTLKALALDALTSGKLPTETQALTKVEFSYWTVLDGTASKTSTVSCLLYRFIDSKEICGQKITESEFSDWRTANPRFALSTSNIRLPQYTLCYNGYHILAFFSKTVRSTAPFLADLMIAEWRYEAIHQYEGEQINFALKKLTAKGFAVDIQAPYIVVQKDRHSRELFVNARQSISARIPEGTSLNEGVCQPSHEQLSAHNALVTWKDSPERISFPADEQVPSLNLSVEQALEQISIELAFIATQGSLVSRYAFKVERLNGMQKQDLLERLRDLGYTAALDAPFIYRAFVRSDDGRDDNFFRQYIMIELPQS